MRHTLRTWLMVSILTGGLLAACGPIVLHHAVLLPGKKATIARDSRLAILPFKTWDSYSGEDGVGFAHEVESTFRDITFEGEPYFKVYDRNQLNDIISEQKLAEFHVKAETGARAGNLEGVDIIITGSIDRPSYDKLQETQTRLYCVREETNKKGKVVCAKYENRPYKCTQQKAAYAVNLRASNTTSGKVIFTGGYRSVEKNTYCPDLGNELSEDQMQAKNKADIRSRIRRDLAPYTAYVSIEFMESDESALDDNPQAYKLFESALKLIQNDPPVVTRACDQFRQVVSAYNKSPAAYYNFGACSEIAGDYEKASAMYKRADSLTSEPKEIAKIALAQKRISQRLAERIRLDKQLR